MKEARKIAEFEAFVQCFYFKNKSNPDEKVCKSFE